MTLAENATAASKASHAVSKKIKIGAQLYTVREFTQTAADFADTIKKVAAMGYDCVQVSGIGADIRATQIKEACDAHGVSIALTHTPLDRIKNNTAQVIEDHKILNAKYIGVGALPWGTGNQKEGYVDFIQQYKPAIEEITAAGFTFMYHNHDFEFTRFDGKTALEFLADQLPQAGFTLDTYWVQAGGGDPAWWIKKLANRVDVIHVKDLVMIDGKPHMAEVYEGNLNWDRIFDAAQAAGVKYAMVEQDDCYGKDPFQCLKQSLENIKRERSETL